MRARSTICALVLLLGCSAKSGPPIRSSAAPGTCSFAVTGAMTADESIATSAMSTYWDGEDPAELPALQVNCDGKVVHVDFWASRRIPASDKISFGPQELALGTPSSKMIAFVRVNGVGPAEATGTLDLTAFDAHHVAGTFDVDLPSSSLRITGAFDAPCTIPECRR